MDLGGSRPFYPVAEPDVGTLEEQYLLEAFRSGWISSIGAFIERFEEEFASFCGARHGITASNGTAALHLALTASGIGNGDEVIVPSMTFVATAAAVMHAGAIPVFVDCEPLIGTISPEAVAHAVTAKTKAIIAVHLYGHPADMDALNKIAAEKGIKLVEDAAEAHGALYRGRRVGALADVATFSFYGNKILTTGEGGMLVTSDDLLQARLRFLRDHAMDKHRRYWHPEVGYNYRLTNLQAAIGVAQLHRFDEISNRRRRVLELYRDSGLESDCSVQLNPSADWADPAVWLVSVLLPDGIDEAMRKRLAEGLYKLGIDTRPYFSPINEMPPYRNCVTVGCDGSPDLLATKKLAVSGLTLPSSTRLSASDIVYISDSFKQELRSL